MRKAALILLLSLAAQSAAGEPSLQFPLDCDLGESCYIQQFVDLDPGPGVADFACGLLTYDGHKGTDIALPSLAAQAVGVTVFAAAAGTVKGARDGMVDILQGQANSPDFTDRDCGNGVVIDHGDGWETQYCHMAQGSIAVSTGQSVNPGTPLGRVGLSGNTEFPHLHISVRQNGAVVDPFDPDGALTCGAVSDTTLWAARPATPPGGIIAVGFGVSVPDYDAVKAGTASTSLRPDAPVVAWGFAFGGQAGDILRLSITGPGGFSFENSDTLTLTQAQFFRAAGQRAPAAGWQSGTYEAVVSLHRDGVQIGSRTTTTNLP